MLTYPSDLRLGARPATVGRHAHDVRHPARQNRRPARPTGLHRRGQISIPPPHAIFARHDYGSVVPRMAIPGQGGTQLCPRALGPGQLLDHRRHPHVPRDTGRPAEAGRSGPEDARVGVEETSRRAGRAPGRGDGTLEDADCGSDELCRDVGRGWVCRWDLGRYQIGALRADGVDVQPQGGS
jgi:hypothetical protein